MQRYLILIPKFSGFRPVSHKNLSPELAKSSPLKAGNAGISEGFVHSGVIMLYFPGNLEFVHSGVKMLHFPRNLCIQTHIFQGRCASRS